MVKGVKHVQRNGQRLVLGYIKKVSGKFRSPPIYFREEKSPRVILYHLKRRLKLPLMSFNEKTRKFLLVSFYWRTFQYQKLPIGFPRSRNLFTYVVTSVFGVCNTKYNFGDDLFFFPPERRVLFFPRTYRRSSCRAGFLPDPTSSDKLVTSLSRDTFLLVHSRHSELSVGRNLDLSKDLPTPVHY